MIKMISKRLYEVYNLVPDGNLADVGADHGILLINLARKFPNNRFLGIENKIGPFETLKKAITDSNLENIETILSDGIEIIPEYIDNLCITGMGGDTIMEILSRNAQNLKNINNIIVSPQNKEKETVSMIESFGFKLNFARCFTESRINYCIFRFSTNDNCNKTVILDQETIKNELERRKMNSIKYLSSLEHDFCELKDDFSFTKELEILQNGENNEK